MYSHEIRTITGRMTLSISKTTPLFYIIRTLSFCLIFAALISLWKDTYLGSIFNAFISQLEK